MFHTRKPGEAIDVLYGTAGFASGLFQQRFPSVEEVLEMLQHLLQVTPSNEEIKLEGALLYGWGYEQWVLGQALGRLRPEERARFGYIGKVGRILVLARPGLKSGQPHEIWPPGATEGTFRETWGFGYNDTNLALVSTLLLVAGGKPIHAAYLHDPPDCMQELGLSFEQWWDRSTCQAEGGGVIAALKDARDNGHIQKIGIGCKQVDVIRQILDVDPELLDVISVTQLNLMEHGSLLRLMNDYADKPRTRPAIEVISAGPYAGGILSRDPRKMLPEQIFCNYERANAWQIEVARRIWDMAEQHGMPNPMPAALQFVAAQNISGMVLGPRHIADVRDNQNYLSAKVPGGFWAELNQLEVQGRRVIAPEALKFLTA